MTRPLVNLWVVMMGQVSMVSDMQFDINTCFSRKNTLQPEPHKNMRVRLDVQVKVSIWCFLHFGLLAFCVKQQWHWICFVHSWSEGWEGGAMLGHMCQWLEDWWIAPALFCSLWQYTLLSVTNLLQPAPWLLHQRPCYVWSSLYDNAYK